MRISDVSSDVCSSDLEDFRQRGRPLPMENVVYVRQLAPVVTGGVIVGGPTSAPPDPLAWTQAPLFATRLVAASAEHSVTDGLTPRAQRSEEHTSELQSLMRISYAVLRL